MADLFKIYNGDSKLILPELIANGIQVDCVVTDPPYELGFMGKTWDSSGIANDVELWKLVYQILKPGGYLLAFSATRTQHRMVCAIEDAGFDIRDQIGWLYGSGFPKSLNISKAIDKHFGKEGKVIGTRQHPTLKDKSKIDRQDSQQFHGSNTIKDEWDITEPVTDEAKQWDGWGTSLKPAWEPICFARKPLEEGLTNAENILKHGVGGININDCRIPIETNDSKQATAGRRTTQWGIDQGDSSYELGTGAKYTNEGRFPANVIHDGSEEVLEEFAKYGERTSGTMTPDHTLSESSNNSMTGKNYARVSKLFVGSSGSAARFFYSAKANSDDRAIENIELVYELSKNIPEDKLLLIQEILNG